MNTLVHELPAQIRRNQELVEVYKTIPTGAFARAMIQRDIDEAIKAMAEQDIVKMVSLCKTLQQNQ